MNSGTPTPEAVATWARFVRLSGRLLDLVEADLKAEGLPPLAWYDALLELNRAAPEGLRPYRLEEEMLLAQFNVSRLIDRLIKTGYAEKALCSKDGRGYYVKITAGGKALLKRMWPVYRAAIARHFSDRLEDGDVPRLAKVLERLARPNS